MYVCGVCVCLFGGGGVRRVTWGYVQGGGAGWGWAVQWAVQPSCEQWALAAPNRQSSWCGPCALQE